MTRFVFVYGSLKRGFRLHKLLDGQQFAGPARTAACYRIVDCGEYPGLLDSEPGNSIHGEVYKVDAECLSRLDQAEGVDEGLYERRRVALLPPHDTREVQAWFYLQATDAMSDCGDRWPAQP